MDQSKTTPAKDSSNASNNQASVDPPSRPSLLGYFYGRITREEAELILKERGGEEGLFLLRDNVSSIGNYVISTCHGTRVFHYSVEKQVDGKYTVPEGEPFLDPAELVEYYRTSKDDLIPQLLYPCERLTGQIPVAFRGVAYHQLEKAMLIEAKKMRPNYADMPWFHGEVTREEAEDRLAKDKHVNGKFLVRQAYIEKTPFAVTLSYKGKPRHYAVTQKSDGLFAFGNKTCPGFQSLTELVDHYHNKSDGLPCKLQMSCRQRVTPASTSTEADVARALGPMRDVILRRVAATLHADMPWFHGKLTRQEAEDRIAKDKHVDGKFLVRQRYREKNTFALTLSYKGEYRHYIVTQKSDRRCVIDDDGPLFDNLMMLVDFYYNKAEGLPCSLMMPCCRPCYSIIDFDYYMMNSARRGSFSGKDSSGAKDTRQENPPLQARQERPSLAKAVDGVPHPDVELDSTGEELERDYSRSSLRKDVTTKKLLPSQIVLENIKLGAGNFGSVMKGVCTMNGRELPVAVKTLKKTELDPGVQCELTKEAEVMKTMDHKHIVRMIGLCEGETMMLVLELAKLGPLDTFLSKNKQVPLWNILELMWQVAQGMAYLEAQGFVHRDLAARNILLCDQHFAKVSDFGLSRALTADNGVYESQGGNWPIKWYAPECIDSWNFDSKSDVWSFGVALWEAAAHGAKPYHKMKNRELLEFLKNGCRLSKPMNCTEEVYGVMLQCWTEAAEDRPTFAQLVPQIKDMYLSHKDFDI